MKYFSSMSFGKDSLAMTLRIIEDSLPLDEVLYFDNGMDFKAIHFVKEQFIIKYSDTKLTVLYPDNEFLYDMFERPVMERKSKQVHYGYSWCGGRVR